MANIMEQIISVVEASGKVVVSVFLSGIAVLIVDWIWPDFFHNLPEWILPSVRLIVVVTAVLSVITLLGSSLPYLRLGKDYALKPLNQRSIDAKLKDLDLYEVLIISKSLAKLERNLQIGPDTPTAISLLEKNLIERDLFGALVTRHYAHQNYTIPMEVWKALIKMEEFKMADPHRLNQLLESRGPREADIVAALPQQHPAVIAVREAE